MNNTKFTPAPWITKDDNFVDGCIVTAESRDGMSEICEVGAAYLDCSFDGGFEEQQLANAHLIASAPDMYELLDNIRILCEWGYNEIELADEVLIKLDKIKDQLKKARGD